MSVQSYYQIESPQQNLMTGRALSDNSDEISRELAPETMEKVSFLYPKVPNNCPLSSIDYTIFFQPPLVFQLPLLLNLENLKSALGESVHCSTQRNKKPRTEWQRTF